MLDLFRVAIRNVGRNKRRTAVTVLTVFIGVLVSVATRGLLNGLQAEIRGNLTRKLHGDLQVHATGYQDSLESQPYKLLLPADPAALARLTAVRGADGEVLITAVAPRLRMMALVNHQKSQTTTPVLVSAIDSRREDGVCPRLREAVQHVAMLDSAKEAFAAAAADDVEALGEATPLGMPAPPAAAARRAEGYHQIMLTPSLQRGLGAAVGDELVVLFQDENNMQQALVAHLVGVVDPGLPGATARMAWMDLASLQRLLSVDGRASELALATAPGVLAEAAKPAVAAAAGPGRVVETWLELGGFLRDAMGLQDVIFTAVLAILFIIVVAAIVNTSLMTVMERTREIGTLMALGYRRRHILLLFLTEAAAIGGMGGVIGLMTGAALVLALGVHGITMTLPGQTVPTILHPEVSAPFLAFTLGLAVVAAVISGLLPAYRASRMRPVTALATA